MFTKQMQQVFMVVFLLTLVLATGASVSAQGPGPQPKTTQLGKDSEALSLPWQLNLPLMLGMFPAPPTLNLFSTRDIPTLDPQSAEDVNSITAIENIFVQLVQYDEEREIFNPEAAENWYVTAGGQVYYFNLRSDIPWVYDNPLTGEISQVLDNHGSPRFVTANDFVYGIKRMCNPTVGQYYSSTIAPVIKGCNDVLNYPDPNNIPQELIDAIGVSAQGDYRLRIELTQPSGYFLSMASMWPLSATPSWLIEENGDRWIEAGIIVTNGRYTLHSWIHGVHSEFVRNPRLPKNLQGEGNIKKVDVTVVKDGSAGYAMWQDNAVDISRIPDTELESHLANYPEETIKVPDLAVFYFGFRTTKAPFDDPRVRRAFSAAFDREKFIHDIRLGQGLPMKHFAPPGIFGAPPIDEVGVGYDPAFAQTQLAAAGYPNCQGFPTVTLLGYMGQATLNWIEFAQQQWFEHLGCSPETIQLEQVSFRELLQRTAADTPDSEAPHMWTLGWGPDYPDENNWVGDVLWCDTPDNRMKRDCSDVDMLIIQARRESNRNRRITLYRQIEESFFGRSGEMPLAPLYLRSSYIARHGWLTGQRVNFGGDPWYDWHIDALKKYYATH